MTHLTLDDAMRAACAAVLVNPPKRDPIPGRWTRTDTYERNGKQDGSILIFDDGMGGIAWNHQTQQSRRFFIRDGDGQDVRTHRLPRDPEREVRERAEREAVERICEAIVRSCRQEPHPYLASKGFPDELGLVHDEPFPLSSQWLGSGAVGMKEAGLGYIRPTVPPTITVEPLLRCRIRVPDVPLVGKTNSTLRPRQAKCAFGTREPLEGKDLYRALSGESRAYV